MTFAAVPDEPFLVDDPLVVVDGSFHVRLHARSPVRSPGDTVPLLHFDQPVQAFMPGWRADKLFTGFAPLLLLELANPDAGTRATWFLDHRMQMMGDHPHRLPPELTALLRSKALPLLRAMMDQVLERVVPALDDRMRAFLRVNQATRAAIGALCLDHLAAHPVVQEVDGLMQRSLLFPDEHGRMRAVDRDHLRGGLNGIWQDRIVGFVSSGRLHWPSPVDGHALHAQGSIVLDDFHFAYRFADERHGLVFLVLVADHLSRIAGLWFPALGLLATHGEPQHALGQLLAPSLPHWFAEHALRWADLLVPYLRRGATRFASVMRGPPGLHLGHQLWNELSGIERMVRAMPDRSPHLLPGWLPGRLPDWIVLDAERGAELYGPLDALFPELAGKVERGVRSGEELAAHAYDRGLFVLRATDEFVSAALRRRIGGHVDGLPVAQRVRGTLAALSRPLVIVIGLRVENRTLDDLDGTLRRIVGFLAGRYPGLVVVFDGHNARVEGEAVLLGSHGEDAARRRPVDVERELVSGLRASLAGQPVTILDTIGAGMATSLAWTAASDGFVSIWGASLAKYRWVGNKPGFVLSNRTNLLHRDALRIYDAPRYMEDPTPLAFVDPELVTDMPDSLRLVEGTPGDPALDNFRVDLDGVLAAIGRFVDGLGRSTGPAGHAVSGDASGPAARTP